jgi:hypothetical protein
MEKYVEYLDSIAVDLAQHQRTMRRLEKELCLPQKSHTMQRYVWAATCLAVLTVCVWMVYTPNAPARINTDADTVISVPDDSIVTDSGLPSDEDALFPGLPDEERGVVYHDIDPTLLNYQGESVGAPYGYWFTQKLTLLANNETNIDLNNGVRWENAQFEREEVENDLHISLNDPVLPNGDCIVWQSVLIDEATGRIIAYKTSYTFFTMETMTFQRSFDVFIFLLDNFQRRDIGVSEFEQSENIVDENGEIAILDFPPVTGADVANAYYSYRVSRLRTLVYFNGGIAIVVEANTAPAFVGDTVDDVDEANTAQKYGQSDKDLIAIMQSLIGTGE